MAKQTEILGMRVQREYKGPAARLVDLYDSQDRSYVGIVFYEEYRNHSALTNSLDGLMEFLQCPVARGITPLHKYGYEEGAFIYETGKCKSVAELIRQASDLGLSPGPRAGLELITQSFEILQGVLKIAEEYAICSHGGLTPWRLMIRPDGKIQIIGFAVPQVEVLDFKNNPNLVPSEDSFRYAPPERMVNDGLEDFSSDIFALALIGFELMTTRPMYDGSISAIQESAHRADVSMRLNQAMTTGWLDQYTHDFLDCCLRLDPEDRFENLSVALQTGKDLLRNPHLKGMSLFDLMAASSQQVLRQSQDVEMLEGATSMFDRNAISEEILEQEQERKRLAEVILPSVDKKELIAEIPQPKNTEGLLDMLRKSSISQVEKIDPVATTLPPEERTPPAVGLQNNLLEALRSSVIVESNEAAEPIVVDAEKKEETSPKKSKAISEKLSSLISTPTRKSPPKFVEPEPPQMESSTQTPEATKPSPNKKPFFMDDSDIPQLGDALPDDESDTTIMARPKPAPKESKVEKKSKESKVQKTPKRRSKPRVTETKAVEKKLSVDGSNTVKESSGDSDTQEIAPLPVQRGSNANLLEAPVPLRAVIPTANAKKYKISLGRGRGNIKQACSPQSTVSQMVSLLLINRLLPIRMDLMGRINSCYRVLEKGVPCSGRRTLDSLKGELILGSVSSRMLTVTVKIHTADNLIQFITPLNWVVSVGSIIDHMISWLRLPHIGWKLQVGDVFLDVHDTLFDVYEEGQDIVIELHRNKPKR